ncbi:EAL domain-containing protein, partial [Paenibacillus sp.]|uniref:EAL domain-containing protein n=1 Tax=Paenibacillus sp. TaxID=58172 RepID=UPI002D54D1E2
VVAEDYGSADALHALLEHALNVFDPTVSIGRKAYAVTGSLGVAIYPDAMSGSERNQNIVNTIVQLAHHLGLTVVAEGVETKEQAEKLVASDCDMVQGYYYSKPVTGSEVLRIASAAETLEQRASL